jgi:hypothetical protein
MGYCCLWCSYNLQNLFIYGFYPCFVFYYCFYSFGIFVILGIDAFAINKERLYEAKKQTKLLEEMLSKRT